VLRTSKDGRGALSPAIEFSDSDALQVGDIVLASLGRKRPTAPCLAGMGERCRTSRPLAPEIRIGCRPACPFISTSGAGRELAGLMAASVG